MGACLKRYNCDCSKNDKGICKTILRICTTVNSVRKKFENPKIYVKIQNGEKRVILRNLNQKFYADTFLRGKLPKLKNSFVMYFLLVSVFSGEAI